MDRARLDNQRLDEFLPMLSFLEKFKVQFLRYAIKVNEERREGWSGYLPFYLFYCWHCWGFSYDYPHGYKNYFICHREDCRGKAQELRLEDQSP